MHRFRVTGRRSLASWVDLNGRRNTDGVHLWQPLVKRLCGRSPAQRLSRPGVEGGGDRGDLLGAVEAQVGAFREGLAQQCQGRRVRLH